MEKEFIQLKYFGIKTDESLTWNEYINDIAIKLKRSNVMLYKVREFVNTRVLKLIYPTYYISLMDVVQNLIFITTYYIYFQSNDAYSKRHSFEKPC